MTPVVHWLGGWASSLRCWEPQLRELYPGCEHRFVDAHAALRQTPADLGWLELPPGHAVTAWSMGSLVAHRWMAAGHWPYGLPLLSQAPIFDFTAGGYGEPTVLRMEEKLAREREAVLRDFWRRMPRAREIPAAWEEAWIAFTRDYAHEELSDGLKFLRQTRIDPEELRPPARWEIVVGENDRLAPPGEWTAHLPAGTGLHHYPGGHLPFWEAPDLVRDCLQRLTA